MRRKLAQQEMMLRQEQQQMQYGAIQSQIHNLEKLNLLRLEQQGHFETIRAYLIQDQCEKALDYVNTLTKQNVKVVSRYAENPIADVALSDAAQQCQKWNIDLATYGSLPKELPLPAIDLSALLYNLFNNAIEGAIAGPEPRYISVEFGLYAGRLCITVRNNSKPVQSWKTTKLDRENHGFGTKIIQEIIGRYNGSYDLTSREGEAMATVTVILPQEEKGTQDQ